MGALCGSAVRNTAVPGTRVGGFFSSRSTSSAKGSSSRRVFSDRIRAAAPPRVHHQHHGRAERERHPAAFKHFEHVGAEEGEIDQQERTDQGTRPQAPTIAILSRSR